MKPHIVIIGGGFGGATCAQRLRSAVHRGLAQVTLIDQHNYFIFYPLLVEAGTGRLHPRHVVVAIRAFTGPATFRMATVSAIDLERREVTILPGGTEPEQRLTYDHLVLAPGSITRVAPIPGLPEHAFQIKGLGDAITLRDHAIRMLEIADATPDPLRRAAMLHFIVVGGNFTGVEVAGELHDYLRRAARIYPNLTPKDCRITLIEIGERILSALGPDLGDYAARKLRACGVDIRLSTSVAAVEATRVALASGETLPARTVVWCAGIEPASLLESLELPKDERGYLLCRPDLRVFGRDDVWAIGDAAVNPDPEGRPYPATAQHAVRQGAHVARNILRVVKGASPRAFVFKSPGSLASLGCRTGVAKIFGVKLSGFAAWFLWRTVYLLKMPGVARRVRVALDWTLDLLFGHDHVQLGVQRKASGRSPHGFNGEDRD